MQEPGIPRSTKNAKFNICDTHFAFNCTHLDLDSGFSGRLVEDVVISRSGTVTQVQKLASSLSHLRRTFRVHTPVVDRWSIPPPPGGRNLQLAVTGMAESDERSPPSDASPGFRPTTMASEFKQPMSEKLITAIVGVLEINRDDVLLCHSFTELGGDDDTAGELVTSCSRMRMALTKDEILRCKTIAELQTCLLPARNPSRPHLVANTSSSRESDDVSSHVSSIEPKRSSNASDPSNSSSRTSRYPMRPITDDMLVTEELLMSTSQVPHAALLQPTTGFFKNTLVAFLTLVDFSTPEHSSPRDIVLVPHYHQNYARSQVPALRCLLQNSTTITAIPTVWIIIEQMPLMPSGACNRRRLQTWIQNLNEDLYEQIISVESYDHLQEPATDMEHALQHLTSAVLRMPTGRIGMNFSFRQLGGDELSALQLVAGCKSKGIQITTDDIAQSDSIAHLAFLASYNRDALSTSEGDTAHFKLSPIQQLYFQTGIGGDYDARVTQPWDYRFNQSILVRINAQICLDDIHAAIEAIVGHHSMLRARFNYMDGTWMQSTLADVSSSYIFGRHLVNTEDQVISIVQLAQASINIETGPVFAAELICANNSQHLLYLVAHYLVVDHVSWRIIIHDLNELLQNGSLYSGRSMSFQRWNKLQEAEIKSLKYSFGPPLSTIPGDFAFWGLDNSRNAYGDTEEVSFALGPEPSYILHSTCDEACYADPIDVYLATLLLSFFQTFPERAPPVIWNQEYGREPWDQDINISETVGWFTTLSPFWLDLESSEDIIDILCRIKEMRQAIPYRGWAYFASRFLGPEAEKLELHDWPYEIVFTNGRSLQHVESNDILQQLPNPGQVLGSRASDIGSRVGRIALFEVSTTIDKGIAKVKFLYNRESRHQDRIVAWVSNFEHLLLETITQLRCHTQEPTHADMQLPDMGYDSFRCAMTPIVVAGSVGDIDPISDQDNAHLLPSIVGEESKPLLPVHELIELIVKEDPDAPAVASWDGHLCYRQLSQRVSCLAHRLSELGVERGSPVPLILGKSMWSSVAILAVLRVGGCFVPLDTDDTFLGQRIVKELNSTVVLATDVNAGKYFDLKGASLVIVNEALFSEQPPRECLVVQAGHAACMIFFRSSAKSKVAKGVFFTHEALSAAFIAQGPALGINFNSRVLQLSAFTSDIALAEILTTLIHGGCVCVPNAPERTNNLAGAIQQLEANWTYLTPVLARRLLPSMVPTIETICFRTRRLDPDTLARWSGKTRVLLTYGTADICPLGISVTEVSDPDQLSCIAPPFVGKFWIIHLDNNKRIGELVIESPTLAHKLTGGSSPKEALLAAQANGYVPYNRFFKTGHWVKYTTYGTIEFITSCRNDVTVNGNAIPVSTVEQHIRRCIGTEPEVVVDAIRAKEGTDVLAAFVELGSNFDGDEDLTSLSAMTKERIFIVRKLVESFFHTMLPSYMLPVAFIPLRILPLTSSLKVHRRKLLKMTRNLSKSALLGVATVAGPEVTRTPNIKPLPLTHVEGRMRRIWGRLLKVDPKTITGTQSFLRLGGDAHLVDNLVFECRKEGLAVPPSAILQNASLTTLCQSITLAEEAPVPMVSEPTSPPRAATESLSPIGEDLDFPSAMENVVSQKNPEPVSHTRVVFKSSSGSQLSRRSSRVFKQASKIFRRASKVFRRMSSFSLLKPKSASL